MSVESSLAPPDLDDAAQFIKKERVPIFIPHVRKHVDEDGKPFVTQVDPAQLKVVFDNTRRRHEAGEIPIVRLGHIRREDPEHRQPPTVGFLGPPVLGTHNGKPAILADMHIYRNVEIPGDGGQLQTYSGDYIIKQYCRRSAEVFRKQERDGYIDAVALLTRSPELELGLVAHSKNQDIELFELEQFCGADCDMDKNIDKSSADDSGDMAEQAAIRKISHGVALELAAHKEFVGALAAAIAGQINAKDDAADEGGDDLDREIEESGGEDHDAGAASPPSATNAPPAEPGGDNTKDEEDFMANENVDASVAVKMATLEAENARLQSLVEKQAGQIASLETFAKDEQSRRRNVTRKAKLTDLRRKGAPVDPDDAADFESFSSLTDAEFDARVSFMERVLPPAIVGAPVVESARLHGDPRPVAPAGDPNDAPFTTSEVEAFMVANNVVKRDREDNATFGARVVEMFKRDRAAKAAK